MSKLANITFRRLLVVVFALSLTSCAVFDGRKDDARQGGQVFRVHSVKNLSGRPLSQLEGKIYGRDSLRLQQGLDSIRGEGSKLDFMKLMSLAFESAMKDRGYQVVEAGAEAELHVAITAWNADDLNQNGQLRFSTTAFLVGGDEGKTREIQFEGSYQLLNRGQEHGIIGAGRIIEGHYEGLAYNLASKVLDELQLAGNISKKS